MTAPLVDLLLAELDDASLATLAQRLRPYLYAETRPGTLLTPAEAAQRLSVHPPTLVRAAAAGRVNGGQRVGKAWRFDAHTLALAPPANRPSRPPPPPRRRSPSSSAARAIRGGR